MNLVLSQRNGSLACRPTIDRPAGLSLLDDLRAASLIPSEDWEALPDEMQDRLGACAAKEDLLPLLVEQHLLTDYQAARIAAGKAFGLVLGNYRVLDRLGAGAMGVVFRAEHVDLRRPVAIKVLARSAADDPRLLLRFLTEMRAVALLQHPNIVLAMDAGKLPGPDPESPPLRYFVMEYVPGQDLEEMVLAQGPLAPALACDLIYQVACALEEAHRHKLVHRDLKPSNVRVTPEGQAKLLDFGLARHLRSDLRLTEPGTVLGTVDYLAPEQARDASGVDIRSDIYGLGGTLFWCLTGQPPFPPQGHLAQDLAARMTQPPPAARAHRPEVPAELDAVLARMMALDPDDRYATPQAAAQALLPFLRPELREHVLLPPGPTAAPQAPPAGSAAAAAGRRFRVLLVDDEPAVRAFCRFALASDGLECAEAGNGSAALEALRAAPYDLALVDVDMPGMTGPQLLQEVRATPPAPHLKVIMVSGRSPGDEMSQLLLAGADDFLTKPFSVVQLRARVKAALRLKEAQERTALLNQHLLRVNHELEQGLSARTGDLVHARNALVLALAKLVEYRDRETGSHLLRMQRYSRLLAEEAARLAPFAGLIDDNFLEMITCCAPLHDIGKVGLPDHILLKPGKLTPEERVLMQAHTIIGADTLRQVARQHGFAVAFLQMAADIARHHHERFDGRGYPDGLAGADIPLAAQVVAVGDVYDALRARRVYKPALSHAAALQIMSASTGQFDPALLQAFLRCAPRFEQVVRELAD